MKITPNPAKQMIALSIGEFINIEGLSEECSSGSDVLPLRMRCIQLSNFKSLILYNIYCKQNYICILVQPSQNVLEEEVRVML